MEMLSKQDLELLRKEIISDLEKILQANLNNAKEEFGWLRSKAIRTTEISLKFLCSCFLLHTIINGKIVYRIKILFIFILIRFKFCFAFGELH